MINYKDLLDHNFNFFCNAEGFIIHPSNKKDVAATFEGKMIAYDSANGDCLLISWHKSPKSPWPHSGISIHSILQFKKQYNCVHNIERYAGAYSVWLSKDYVVPERPQYKYIDTRKDPTKDGACCANPKCGQFIYMAKPGTICYSCRQDPYRCSELNVWPD